MPQTVGQYLGKTKGPVITQHQVSDEYRSRYDLTFGNEERKFCPNCDRLRVWCECKLTLKNARSMGRRVHTGPDTSTTLANGLIVPCVQKERTGH